jgi:hypothetical protein
MSYITYSDDEFPIPTFHCDCGQVTEGFSICLKCNPQTYTVRNYNKPANCGQDRLLLRYQFTPTDKPNESWTNTFKIVKKDDFMQLWITNGADKYCQYRLSREQAKQLIGFLNANT